MHFHTFFFNLIGIVLKAESNGLIQISNSLRFRRFIRDSGRVVVQIKKVDS